jgi:hypothetical protein
MNHQQIIKNENHSVQLDITQFFNILINGAKNNKFLIDCELKQYCKHFTPESILLVSKYMDDHSKEYRKDVTHYIQSVLENNNYSNPYKPPEFYAEVNYEFFAIILNFCENHEILTKGEIDNVWREYNAEYVRYAQNKTVKKN